MESLKFVLSVIAKVRDMSLAVELRYRDIQERYRTLSMYHIPVSWAWEGRVQGGAVRGGITKVAECEG